MKHIKTFESFISNTNVDSTDDTYLTEQSLEDLHAKIEKYYGRKLEPSQIIAMTGKDDEIATLISKYRKLKRSGS